MNASELDQRKVLPSFHDERVASYEVRCESREIILRIRPGDWAKDRRERTVEFSGVEGYHLKNDAFGNIILSMQRIPLDKFMSEYGAEIEEGYRTSGAPGGWAADLRRAQNVLARDGIDAYTISSSYGLSGWVLAKDISVSDV